jgi:hypothetical protein
MAQIRHLKGVAGKFVFLNGLASMRHGKAPAEAGAFFILCIQYKGWAELMRHAIPLDWRGVSGFWA